MNISPATEIIEELRQGRMVVLMDDEDRENEGDLVMVAEHCRPEDVNFMAKYGRGLICLTLTPGRCRQLNLPLMVNDTQYQRTTNFTLSIEAAEGVTTGISAADRATTIQAAAKKDAKPSDIVTPGHIFPLMAQQGGVLTRAGHTEAGVDLARLAGAEPASVICEIMNEDGTMARLPELLEFSEKHKLKIGTIADLIRYRLENESTVERVAEGKVPTPFGEFCVIAYHDGIHGDVHLALIKGDIKPEEPTLVRVHVQESLLDLFTTAHRPGSFSLSSALSHVADAGAGVVVVLREEESANDLSARISQFAKDAEDAEKRKASGSNAVLRTYGLGSQILADLGVRKMRVMGHKLKVPAMSGFGLEIVEYVEDLTDDKSRKKVSG
ncbi:MAG: 3,4-dihydroxy-2-butanone-4-phosphate synthase [Acidiferrobacterales bacterium]|jgi:3,4-dihydroxy 2-butanone 4-phosphate synthase/GTP cyclohydrolase II|nr:3,4-dihydroxy-2-butanone-4-phosphate synthase [Acidiferrobacterales bacterium]